MIWIIINTPGPTGVENTGGTRGPGCRARERQGLAFLKSRMQFD